MAENGQDSCFVISPIGDQDSAERNAADNLLKYIIEPVAGKEHGLRVVRADRIVEPGSITRQIIDHLVDAPVVIADMTGHNPNVFYELAVRHAAGGPVIHMIEDGQRIPFDVATERTVFYRLDLEGVHEAKDALNGMLSAIRSHGNEEEPDSPLANALRRTPLGRARDPRSQQEARLVDLMHQIRGLLAEIESLSRSPYLPGKRFELRMRRVTYVLAELLGALPKQASEEILVAQPFQSSRSLRDLGFGVYAEYRELLEFLQRSETLDPSAVQHFVQMFDLLGGEYWAALEFSDRPGRLPAVDDDS